MAGEMSKHFRTTLRYDGPALGGHEMDVQDLAPALLALADLIQLANRKFNGAAADIKVFVSTDVEQRCFMIDISLVQSFLDQAKGFLATDHVKTVHEIAEWIGILGSGSVGLFHLLKFLRGTKNAKTPLQIQSDGKGNVIITSDGNTIIVPQQVYQLAQDSKVLDKAKGVMRPLAKDGVDSLTFLDGKIDTFTANSEEADGIGQLPRQPLSDTPRESMSQIRGQVRIKSAQFEGGAPWALLWNGRPINAEMAGKASEWVADFQANKIHVPPNSILDVSMIETAQLDAQGLMIGKPAYRVLMVHSVTPPPRTIGIFDDQL